MLLDLLWQSRIDDTNKIYMIIVGILAVCCVLSMMGKKDKDKSMKSRQYDQNISAVACGTFVIMLFLYYQYR